MHTRFKRDCCATSAVTRVSPCVYVPHCAVVPLEASGGFRRLQEASGGFRRLQEASGGFRRLQEVLLVSGVQGFRGSGVQVLLDRIPLDQDVQSAVVAPPPLCLFSRQQLVESGRSFSGSEFRRDSRSCGVANILGITVFRGRSRCPHVHIGCLLIGLVGQIASP